MVKMKLSLEIFGTNSERLWTHYEHLNEVTNKKKKKKKKKKKRYETEMKMIAESNKTRYA